MQDFSAALDYFRKRSRNSCKQTTNTVEHNTLINLLYETLLEHHIPLKKAAS